MLKQIELKVIPAEINDIENIRKRAIHKSRVEANRVQDIQIVKRSIDARGKRPFYLLRVELYIDEAQQASPVLKDTFQNVSESPKVHIVGAGPAGYFAALQLIEDGYKPILFDRGKDVRERRRDLKAIQQDGVVNPNSNYCFGEGGAGTYSDGKLYTRSHKRGNITKILQLLVEHGAKSDIMIDAHPHIGSNKLPQIVANIRETILHHGGEIHFNSNLTDIIVANQKIEGIIINEQEEYKTDALILATGHSARDVYYLLDKKGIQIEAKPFALGVRVEHPQSLIDKLQYGQSKRAKNLPASSYKLTCQVENRGVFSFCMCPGGLVVPASTAPGELVVNGMSLSRRDSPFANSGTVVSVELEDLQPFEKYGVFAGLEFQKMVEQNMFKAGDGTQKAPSQRMTDFVNNQLSSNLPDSSYIPGLLSSKVHEILPNSITNRLQRGMKEFGRKMKGYYSNEAVVVGTESRTSAPIRIPRNKTTYMHDEVSGLFPCGEGAGFAGGIISAALDGQNVAKAVKVFFG